MNCSFCEELDDSHEGLFYKKIGEKIGEEKRIIFTSSNWNIMPTIGSFVPGYLLIVSNKHILSAGHAPIDSIFELENIIKKVKQAIFKKYNKKSIVFEHGCYNITKRGGCCVDHAHIHILPCDEIIITKINPILKYKKIKSVVDLKDSIKNKKSYVYINDSDCAQYLIQGDLVPSQYMRQIIAKELGVFEKWDWRHHFGTRNIKETLKVFSEKDFL